MQSPALRSFTGLTLLLALVATFLTTGCQPWPPKGIESEPRTVEIGLMGRKQYNPDPYANRIYRHIDTMLQDQSLIGFNNEHERPGAWYYPMFCTWKGVVGRTEWMNEKRPRYVTIDGAKTFVRNNQTMPIVTDWYRIRVSQSQADALDREWKKLENNVPHFRLFGRNCATIAAEALIRAGILRPSFTGIRGIDRPENLIKMIYEQYPDTVLERGYFGYVDGKATIELLPVQDKQAEAATTAKPAVQTPSKKETPVQTSEVDQGGSPQTSEITQTAATAPASEAESDSTGTSTKPAATTSTQSHTGLAQ